MWVGNVCLRKHKGAVRGKTGKTKIIINKSRGEVPLVEQDTIEKFS